MVYFNYRQQETWECHTMEALSFILKNLQKLRNNSWAKNLRYSAWLDRSVFQLLKTLVKAKKPHSWMQYR
jgi:hypothetical protein